MIEAQPFFKLLEPIPEGLPEVDRKLLEKQLEKAVKFNTELLINEFLVAMYSLTSTLHARFVIAGKTQFKKVLGERLYEIEYFNGNRTSVGQQSGYRALIIKRSNAAEARKDKQMKLQLALHPASWDYKSKVAGLSYGITYWNSEHNNGPYEHDPEKFKPLDNDNQALEYAQKFLNSFKRDINTYQDLENKEEGERVWQVIVRNAFLRFRHNFKRLNGKRRVTS